MKNLFKKQIQENHVTRKEFSYSKGQIALKFQLRTDIQSELKDFKELMEKAIEDIEKELEPKSKPQSYFGGGAG